jgi:4-amino-4-deoxy-L-arabinose transferase-like glycosyltransferase
MTSTASIRPLTGSNVRGRRWTQMVMLWWLAALVPLVADLGQSPVRRTQEARVVETARQMLAAHSWQAWLYPPLNGEVRLRKPPMAYWMGGVSFVVLGVSEFAGRLPFALSGWLMVGVTYVIASRLFGRRAGALSAACLLGSYLFIRHSRLAETDAPAALFATVAAGLFWQAVEIESGWTFHLAAAATGLSFFAKQGPGAFPLLFFISWSLVRRRPRALVRFVICGAPLTLLILAGWWYGLAAYTRGIAQFQREWAETTEGLDHPAPFYIYFPDFLLAVAPWSFVTVGALVAAGQRFWRDQRLAGLLVWAACCFVPLWFLGNKQIHYLLPTMPPVMILTGWLIDQAVRSADAHLRHASRILLFFTILGCVFAPVGLPIAGRIARGSLIPLDFLMAAGICAMMLLSLWLLVRRSDVFRAAAFFAGAWALIFPAMLDQWNRTVTPVDERIIAAEIQRRCGDGPFVFYGGDTSLPLCFALRAEIPRVDDHRPDLLLAEAANAPTLLVVWKIPEHGLPPQLPPAQFVPVIPDIGSGGQHFRIYGLAH